MSRPLVFALGLAALLSAVACGSGAETDVAAPAETESASTTEAPSSTTTASAEESGEEPDSLDAFFGFDPNDPDASQEQLRRWQMSQQELIAVCMANQGFEYVPALAPGNIDIASLDEEQYAREQGFGISTRYNTVDEAPGEQWVDPNGAIVAAMSDSEEAAYYAALYGEETGLEAGAEESDATFWGGGCQGEAAQEVFGQADEILRDLEPLFSDLEQRVAADPRLADADQGWTACMSDRGYDYDNSEHVFNTALPDLQNRYQEIVGQSDPFADWIDEEIEEFYANNSPQEIQDFFTQFEEQARQEVDEEAVAALQEEEIALAVANYECGEERREIEREVTSELEKDFIRENRDALIRARNSLDVG